MSGGRKPVFIYDSDCGFCRWWVSYWEGFVGEEAVFSTFQELRRKPKDSSEFRVGSKIYRGAEGIFRLLSLSPRKAHWLWLYEKVPPFDQVSEWAFRFIAARRNAFFVLTKLLWGKMPKAEDHSVKRAVFLRALALIYLMAFVSFGIQISGLIGENGILPAQAYLAAVDAQFGASKFILFPTLAWLNASTMALVLLAFLGAIIAVLVLVGFTTWPLFLLLWLFYLSLVTVGQQFMSFQWDILLLEVGFLTIFFAPLRVLKGHVTRPSGLIVWFYRLILFRLIFGSGVVKLMSGDPVWRDLSALDFHYFTQPLPNPIAWFAHQLPSWFDKISVLSMFGIQLVLPFFIFLPRKPRMIAALGFLLIESLIAFTGNYTFFNFFSIVLLLFLVHDADLLRMIPKGFCKRLDRRGIEPKPARKWMLGIIALIIGFLNLVHIFGLFIPPGTIRSGDPLAIALRPPFHIVNRYGLFAVMTTERNEIIIEGSNDGETWLPYEFKHKPGSVLRAPPNVAPHQPRLDWQMWFAALGTIERNPWFVNLSARLLTGQREVLDLLETNPFPDAPPRFLRARLFEYQFTSPDERKETGAWWKREEKGLYLPPISIENLQRGAIGR